MKRLSYSIALLAAVFLLTACGQHGGSPSPPDLKPVGEGLKVIGFALVASTVVLSVGRWFGKSQ